jgi:pimeloyl-ACP methyl ester carboxylesterase
MIKNETVFTNEIYEIGGVKTNVYIGGKGEPLLWLPGAGAQTPELPIYKELVKKFKVYLVDHPGFNDSERPEWLRDFDDYNYFYRDFLNFFSIDKAHIIGHSFGGRVAIEFAISHPERVKSLILISPGGLYVKGVKTLDLFMMSQQESMKLLFYNDCFTESLLKSVPTDRDLEIAAKNLTTVARLSWERAFNPKFPRLLRYIEAPTCLIWGKEDKLLSVEHGRIFQQHIKGSVLHELEECGHIPYVEKQEQCIKIISDFLSIN